MVMLTRRDTLRILGAAGLAAPVLTACGSDAIRSSADPAGMRLVSAEVARSAGTASAVPGVVRAMGALADDLWGLLGPADRNLALSPYSLAVALAMTVNGAAGTSRSQMLEVLHIDSLATYNGGIGALTRAIEDLAGPVTLDDGTSAQIALATANQLFGDGGTTWGRPFLTVLAKEYGAGMRTVDFRHAAEAARTLINRWTADRTHDRVPTILPPGVVDDTTRLVLVNALYLKAPWLSPFEEQATRPRPFHRSDGTTVSVDMMSSGAESTAVWLRGDHYEGARLPYAGGTLAMTVALADAGHESAALTEVLSGLTERGDSGGLELSLPRWTFRTPSDLKAPLRQLGMTDAFTGRADFRPMSPSDPLYVSDVLHDAFIAVDENGTEAAAATAVVMGETSAQVPRHRLVLDRPFLFVIHDSAHGTPLFVGRVADPSRP
jgi:serpin B